MNPRKKWLITIGLLLIGGSLIAWNMRDSDAALAEPKKYQEDVTLDQVPEPVRATIQTEMAGGGVIETIEKEIRGESVNYEIDILRGSQKIEVEIALDGSVIERESKRRK